MEDDLRAMEWQWHTDLSLGKHRDEDDIAATARIAWKWLKGHYETMDGLTLVMCVVKPTRF